MTEVAGDVVKFVLLTALIFGLLFLAWVAFVILCGFVAEEVDRRRERARHNDRDAACRYWWGDRSGGATQERCSVCNPEGSDG